MDSREDVKVVWYYRLQLHAGQPTYRAPVLNLVYFNERLQQCFERIDLLAQ